MNDKKKLIERLREIASLTPPICQYDLPIELDVMGKKITAYCKPFEQFQDLLREAADALANGVVVREKGEWVYDHWCEFKCSKCGVLSKTEPRGKENFCPNCGADMRKGENG